MPIQKISSNDAFRFIKTNEYSKYPRPDDGVERLFPFPAPVCRPTFTIRQDDNIFTIGSCFAREVDNALTKLGFKVISRDLSSDHLISKNTSENSFFNKYTIHSILNEVRWALDPKCPYPGEKALLEVDGLWEDPQLGGHSHRVPLDELIKFRREYSKSMKLIAEADIVIVTLGLVESWFDIESKLYINNTPPLRLLKSNSNRFELHILGYSEILSALNELHRLITKFGKPNFRMLVTVSPVPLLATFRDEDVLLANSYSKSVQRAAVEEFNLAHKNVNYFPSYEFIALGDPKLNWVRDFRHVHPKVVRRIMSNVMMNYAPNELLKAKVKSIEINDAYKENQYKFIIENSKKVNLEMLDFDALYRVGLSFKKTNMKKEAMEVFYMCVRKNANNIAALENLIHISFQLGDIAITNEALIIHLKNFPNKNEFRKKMSFINEKIPKAAPNKL